MSEPKLISPLLDGFAMGNPISEHNGICCCPAIKENTDKKYIVKMITVPASQVQMDALLLAGAFKDPSGAMDYFHEKCDDILKEAELLKKLSKQEGFLSYENWQMEPITKRRLGYEIYLLGSYKRSLEKYMRHHAVTHLEAVNLGLDMCAALSVCREAGALYVDLKPSNIFMSDKKEYRIGDLGFISMDALSYTALPEKYLSSYTPPELYDPMANVNMTVDTYALGMLLYQLYNDGTLPFKGKAPEEVLPTPVHADYELAEIIMKAIHPDPTQRWTDPKEMEKALAAYMQRNSVNDVPITPLKIRKPKKKKEKKQETPVVQEAADSANTPVTEAVSRSDDSAQPEAMENPDPTVQEDTESTEAVIPAEEISESDAPEASEETIPAEEQNVPEGEQICLSETEAVPEIVEEDTPVFEEAVESEADDSEDDKEETTPETEEAVNEEIPLSDELAKILAKADDLIAHETPESVVIPEIPEAPDPFAFATEDDEEIDDSDIPYDPLMDEEPEEKLSKKKKKSEKKFADPKYKRRKKRFIRCVISLFILALIGVGGFWYYQNLYLLTIDGLTISGGQENITVQVDSSVKEGLLSVSCKDHYGNSATQKVVDGKAVFTGLESNTMYNIELQVEGFHGLVGKTSDVYTTEATTKIVSFTSVAGTEDGSVMLNFTVDGDEPDEWAVIYSAEGEDTRRQTFTGHSVTIDGLAVGKVYTFKLDAGEYLSLGGEKTLEAMARRLILAENLTVTSSDGTDMTVSWNAPGDALIDSWVVRCYNSVDYDEKLTVTETTAQFTGINPVFEYTIEVTASGMTQPARTGITANPINVGSFHVDETASDKLQLDWEFTGNAPEGGWLLLYSIDGSENYVVKCDKPSASVSPKIPGARYVFTLQAADGTSIFGNVHTFTAAEAVPYEGNALKAEMLTASLLKTPEDEKWYCENIAEDAMTNQFTVGESVSIALRSSDTFYLPGTETKILYVVRDAYGNVLAKHVSEEKISWKKIWNGGDTKNGELNVPSIPASAGEFVLELYFDGMRVAQLPFTIN